MSAEITKLAWLSSVSRRGYVLSWIGSGQSGCFGGFGCIILGLIYTVSDDRFGRDLRGLDGLCWDRFI